MSSIMVLIGPGHPELFALELGRIAEFDFVYTLASTNINQSVPNLDKTNKTIRSRMSLIMDLIGPELSELSVLELKKLPYLTSGFSPEIFEGVVAFSGVVKLGSITNVTRSAT